VFVSDWHCAKWCGFNLCTSALLNDWRLSRKTLQQAGIDGFTRWTRISFAFTLRLLASQAFAHLPASGLLISSSAMKSAREPVTSFCLYLHWRSAASAMMLFLGNAAGLLRLSEQSKSHPTALVNVRRLMVHQPFTSRNERVTRADRWWQNDWKQPLSLPVGSAVYSRHCLKFNVIPVNYLNP